MISPDKQLSIVYLHGIMQKSDDQLVKVVESQKTTKRKGDFYTQSRFATKLIKVTHAYTLK